MNRHGFFRFRLHPLPMLADQIHEAFHGFGFGGVELQQGNALGFRVGFRIIADFYTRNVVEPADDKVDTEIVTRP